MSAEEVNEAFAEKADTGPLEGILKYNEDPIVSTDIAGRPTRRSSTRRSRW